MKQNLKLVTLALLVMIQLNVNVYCVSYMYPGAFLMPHTWFEIYRNKMMDHELKANLYKYLKSKKHSIIIGKRGLENSEEFNIFKYLKERDMMDNSK
ncbi:unnamed protein product [Brachionus calyciflorus]|uniref:Uncharacterized protein n=1 Tax=Brachionus calyciflorus TaxID=104777 RepID=A0A813QMN1_9BILA|nr:unnamed protein product [Brachionus calyciflorus]